jgi:hypothetical protein
MSAYKLVLGAIVIVICALVWIPMENAVGILYPILNAGITDAATIQRNVIFYRIFYYSLFFIILITVIYIIKTDKGEEEAPVVWT